MTNAICLNEKYSTTRLAIKEKPIIESKLEDKFETILFLPEGKNRKAEGGLRTKGYFKKSYEDKPLITVITVVYNEFQDIEETIQSVINQTCSNIEYIIIDGGSTDGTLDIIKKYENQIDYFVSEEDDGIYEAMNNGLFLATGIWIAFMNGGDSYYSNDAVKDLMEAALLNSDVVYGQTNYIYSNEYSKIVHTSTFEEKKFSMPFCHQSCMVKTKLHKQNPFNTEYKIGADYCFFFYLHSIKSRFVMTNKVIANFKLDGLSSIITRLHRKERKDILLKHNTTFKFRVELFIWEQNRLFKYIVKKLPFSLYLVKIKYYIIGKMMKRKEH